MDDRQQSSAAAPGTVKRGETLSRENREGHDVQSCRTRVDEMEQASAAEVRQQDGWTGMERFHRFRHIFTCEKVQIVCFHEKIRTEVFAMNAVDQSDEG